MAILQPFQSAPTGFAVCRAVYDDDRKLSDFALEETNPALARLLHLSPQALACGLRTVVARLFIASYDWLDFCGQAAIGGNSVSRRVFLLAVGRYLQFDAYPSGPDRCLLQLTDITEDMFDIYKLNSMLTAVDEFIFEYDGEYRCLSVFSTDALFWDHPKDEYVGKTVREALGESYGMLFENAFAETRNTHEKVRVEFDVQTAQGERWFGAEVILVSNISGEERFYAAINDITDAVQADRDLAEENSKLMIINKLVQQVNDRMSIEQVIREIVDTIYIYNVEYRVGFAMLREDNQLQFLYTRVPEGFPDITGECVDMASVPDYTHALHALQSFRTDDMPADPRLAPMRGRLEVLQSYAFLHMPLKYPQMVAGTLTLTSAIPHQWTDYETELLREVAAIMELAIEKSYAEEIRRRAETEVRRLASVVNSSDELVAIADVQHRVIYMNPAGYRMTGLPEGTLGMAVRSFHADEDARWMQEQKVFDNANTGIWVGENRLRTATGQLIPVLQSIFPVHDAQGELMGHGCILKDVSALKTVEAVLSAEKERLRITLQCIGDGVVATDEQGRVTIVNGVAETLTGWPAADARGQTAAQVCALFDETGAALEDPVQHALSTARRALMGENAVLRSRQGQHVAVNGSASPILDAAGAVTGAVLVFRDVTEEKRRQQEITYLSYHDALTGLYNRAFFDEELRRLNTDRQLPISVIMGDVNGLKLANDVFGHAEGDRVLITIARILSQSTRSDDILARIGGDEFCILLPKTSSAAAQNICRRILRKCREYGLRNDVITPPSISMGVATKTDVAEPITETMKIAEQLMYKRKLLESKSVHNNILATIRTTLYEKSRETEEHTARIAENTRAIGTAMGLTEEQLNELELFSVLHDIGKIAVDDRILLKPGPLSESEREEVRRHSETGYRVVRSSPEIAHVADLILAHHEDWDGGGYPQGLSGETIPLLARVLRVADAYDAMTHDQVYRPAIPRDKALREIALQAGRQYDPDVVRTFLALENEGEPRP